MPAEQDASSFVVVDRPVPGVAVVTMNRPERLNAMAFDVMVPVCERLVELGHDNSVRAIVLTGAGGAFSSGADLMFTGRDVDAEEVSWIGLVSRVADPVLDEAVAIGEQITAFSQPGVEMTKSSLHASISAGSLKSYIPMEGIGQLYLRLLTDNFEEAVQARAEGRPAVFRDGG